MKRAGTLFQVIVAVCLCAPAAAAAKPVSGPHETVDDVITTTHPNSPAGFTYTGIYHAAGNPNGKPPYMLRMISYNGTARSFDTTVPARCTASDVELETFGPSACPAGSRLGGGTSEISVFGGSPQTNTIDLFNGANEQIMLARSSGGLGAVARGRINADGSVAYASPTCFPYVQALGCPINNVLQLSSHIVMPPYTKSSGGVVRSYLTTPSSCPAVGYWVTPIKFWWMDGTVDTVVTRQPCSP